MYRYVGPQEIEQVLERPSDRHVLRQLEDLQHWLALPTHQQRREHQVTATFIVDLAGDRWVADRHSEHLACAAGQPVLAAGEITFRVSNGQLSVSEITNQSTGYCPRPDSCRAVATALTAIGIAHPDGFTTLFIFRRCQECQIINIVKEELFECAVCGTALSREWNF